MADITEGGKASSLPYHEPSIIDILTLSSFLLALNVVNVILDRILYCGLVGQVLLGIAWGTPGGKWLASSVEHAVVQLGYLGLISIVFEGGLSASINSMKANLLPSTCVALTGIAAPIGLSFILGPMIGATPIQSFAAGAALCATSLGTTFTVLGTSGLVSTRLGSVLTTAAMMDDVVGLVMVQVVSSLGSESSLSPTAVLRPVLVSAAYAVVLPLACRHVVRPSMAYLARLHGENKTITALSPPQSRQSTLVVHTCLLLALIVGASYAGASVLLAAYLAGVMIAWWDGEVVGSSSTAMIDAPTREMPEIGTITSTTTSQERGSSIRDDNAPESDSTLRQPRCDESRATGLAVYEYYYSQAVERVLKPFFFASIGFSIPISQMFEGSILWRGLVYTALMMIGKMLCGVWLMQPPLSIGAVGKAAFSFVRSRHHALLSMARRHNATPKQESPETTSSRQHNTKNIPVSLETLTQAQAPARPGTQSQDPNPAAKPLSLYPAGVISFAMVARGEVGFLISAVAESNGILQSAAEKGSSDASQLFLVITWAIVLCTIIGPVCVGLLVKRIRRLEDRRSSSSTAARAEIDSRSVLGIWGVS